MAQSLKIRTRGTRSIFKTNTGVYTFRYFDANGNRKEISLRTKKTEEKQRSRVKSCRMIKNI